MIFVIPRRSEESFRDEAKSHSATKRRNLLLFCLRRFPRSGNNLGLHLLLHRLLRSDHHILMLDLQSQPVERAHIKIRHPDQREPRNQIPAPPVIQHREPCHPKKKQRHIMREAILAGKQVEKLPHHQRPARLCLLLAHLPRLAKHLLMRHRPAHAGNRQRQQKQISKLIRKRHPRPCPIPCCIRCTPRV
jgi:hypothetical protein